MSKPAARLTDQHVCPQVTVLVPHVGGPIAFPGEPTVLIAGVPAARVGDFCVCVGPPDVIATGSFTVLIGGKPAARMGDFTAHGGSIVSGVLQVLIGDSGGGAGSPAAFTMSAARATGAPFTRVSCASEGVLEQVKDSPLLRTGDPETSQHYVEIELVDRDGRPVGHERFRIEPPGGKPIEGFLDEHGFTRIDGIDAGTCRIAFPDLDGAGWKPQSGDPGKLTGQPDAPGGELHAIRPGDHLARVAAQRGFRSYRPIWDAPANQTLRTERGTPHILAQGDLVAIPAPNLREVERSTDGRHRFVADIEALVVRVKELRWDGRPVEDSPDRVLLDGREGPFTMPEEGVVEVPVDPNVDRVSLKYPTRDVTVRLGFLQPVTTVAGVRERLNNLGYLAGDSDDPKKLEFRSAVEEFQCDHGLVVDGVVGPVTRDKLVKVHGC